MARKNAQTAYLGVGNRVNAKPVHAKRPRRYLVRVQVGDPGDVERACGYLCRTKIRDPVNGESAARYLGRRKVGYLAVRPCDRAGSVSLRPKRDDSRRSRAVKANNRVRVGGAVREFSKPDGVRRDLRTGYGEIDKFRACNRGVCELSAGDRQIVDVGVLDVASACLRVSFDSCVNGIRIKAAPAPVKFGRVSVNVPAEIFSCGSRSNLGKRYVVVRDLGCRYGGGIQFRRVYHAVRQFRARYRPVKDFNSRYRVGRE